jgi:DNA segregation ATPase FtsK/SpoIIIE-like protein
MIKFSFRRQTSHRRAYSLNQAESRQKRLHLLGGAALAGITLWFALALISYHTSDPSWSHNQHANARNWGGIPGSWLSDALLSLFGYSAWWWIVLSGLLAFRIITRNLNKAKRTSPPSHAFLHGSGFTLLLLSSSILESLRLHRLDSRNNPAVSSACWVPMHCPHWVLTPAHYYCWCAWQQDSACFPGYHG